MNKINKQLSFAFGMSALVSNNFISAMRENCNFNINDCKCYFAEKSESNGENINRYEFEIKELICKILGTLELLCPKQDPRFYLKLDGFDARNGVCYFAKHNKTRDEIKNDSKKYLALRKLKQILSKSTNNLLLFYVAVNDLAERHKGNFSCVFDGEGENVKLLDSVGTENLPRKSNLTIIEYECLNDVRKYKIHISDYTINLEASKIDVSSGKSKEFLFEYMIRAYKGEKKKKKENFMALYKSDESLFSKFKKNPHQYMIEEDEFKVTVDKDNETDKSSEEILNFSFYL